MSLLFNLIEETRAPSATAATPATPATVATKPPVITDKAGSVASVATVAGAPPPAAGDIDDLADALPVAIAGTSITAEAMRAALSDEELANWHAGELGSASLRALALALHARKQREAGQIPDGYDEVAECKNCGPVWLFADGQVQGCPWCFNRAIGLPIPKPTSVHCADCRHRLPVEHPHMNRCGAGIRADNPTGQFWTTDRRSCGRWLPRHG